MEQTTRIPLAAFSNYPKAILIGQDYGIRWEACLACVDEHVARGKAERKANPPAKMDWRAVYVVGWKG